MGKKVHIGAAVAVLAVFAVIAVPDSAGAATGKVDGFGQFGDGSPSSHVAVPATVALPGAPSAIQASNQGDYALVGGSVYAWGFGTEGELGDGAKVNSFDTPVEVDFPTGVTITALGDARNTGLAVDSDGNAWAWGDVDDGDHCQVTGKKQFAPVEVPGLPPVIATAGGQGHSLWLAADGTVWACGNNSVGQLGDGSFTDSTAPVEVTGLTNVVAISSGNQTSAALTATGDLYTWGRSGDVGTGTKGNVDVPTQIPGTFRQVYAGGSLPSNVNTLALTASGAVEAWGVGYSNAPQTLSLPFQAQSVMAAGNADGAIDTVGNLWTWNLGKPKQATIVATGQTEVSGTADSVMSS